jgi:RND superfamily putative drug exporter
VTRFAEWVLRHRRAVYLFWIVLFVLGGAAAGQLADRYTYDYSVPGQPGYDTEQQIIHTFGQAAGNSIVPVVTVPDGQTVAGSKAAVDDVYASIKAQVPQTRVVSYADSADPALVTADGRSTFGLVYSPPATPGHELDGQIRTAAEAAAARHGLTVTLTGFELLARGTTATQGPGVLVETLLGALGALAVLAFVFASFLAFVPLIIAAVAVLATFLIVFGISELTDVSAVVQFLVALVGLGVAIDYSLLLVTRWREERAHGADNHTAVVTAMRTAGHAVLASAVTVAISLIALLLVPAPWLRSMGVGGLLIPTVSAAVVLTLLPALLLSIGPKADWPRLRREQSASRGWTAWSRGVLRQPVLAALVALGMLGVLASPVFGVAIGNSSTASLSHGGPAYDSMRSLSDGGVGSGVVTPIVALTRGDGDAAATAIRQVPGVRAAVAGPSTGGLTVVDVIPDAETVDSSARAVVDQVSAAASSVPGFVGVAGNGPLVQDYLHAVYRVFPYVLLVIALITYLLLVRTFRSLVLPLQAVLLNLISVAAAFGVSVYFWQDGHGSGQLFGVSATGALPFWMPVLVFAFLFGLSMDYEVFILARMREEYDRGGSTSDAVIVGLGRTGRLVTSAALILFFAFAALSSAPATEIKEFATTLGVGILIDATIVRALLVPALVTLTGRWNWWLPGWAARVLRVPVVAPAAAPGGDEVQPRLAGVDAG